MTQTAELYWDPFDTEIDTAPYEIWRRLRDDAPLYYNDRYDFYALSRNADVEAAHLDPKTFSSARGIVLEMMGGDLRATGQMIFLDPPDHTALRHLVSRAFTPRRIAAIEDQIRGMCATLLDAQRDKKTFDYVQDFGADLPSMVISALLGVPEEERDEQRHIIDDMFHIEPGVGMVNEISATASMNIIGYLSNLLAKREADPQDDMLTALVQAEITTDGGTVRRLTREEAAGFGMLLFTAGTETVARLMGWTAVVLADHPDQREELANDFSLIPNAVEELLRYEAPSPVQGRMTNQEAEFHGQVIPKDAKVLLLTGAAGRDDRAFTEPDRFDIHRDLSQHLSFGYGIHYCIGAALARMEARIAIEETLKRFPTWEVDHDHARRLHTSTVRGWAEVPITV